MLTKNKLYLYLWRYCPSKPLTLLWHCYSCDSNSAPWQDSHCAPDTCCVISWHQSLWMDRNCHRGGIIITVDPRWTICQVLGVFYTWFTGLFLAVDVFDELPMTFAVISQSPSIDTFRISHWSGRQDFHRMMIAPNRQVIYEKITRFMYVLAPMVFKNDHNCQNIFLLVHILTPWLIRMNPIFWLDWEY